MRDLRLAIPFVVLMPCLLASLPALARHEVDGDLLAIGRAEGTWWYGGRTGGMRLILDRGTVRGELSGAILTDVGQRLSERKGLVEGTVVEQRVRLVAEVEGATPAERTHWRIAGTIVPSQGIASGTIEGGGSWQVTFPLVEDAAEYGYMAFKLTLDRILAEPQAVNLTRHYFARRRQLTRYASWLLKGPDDPRRETPTQRADRLRALGEINRGYLRLHQEVWGGALRACQEGGEPPEPGAAGLGGLLGGGAQWSDAALWRVARREAPRLMRRWQERHDLLTRMLSTSAEEPVARRRFPRTTEETALRSRIGLAPVPPRGAQPGARGMRG